MKHLVLLSLVIIISGCAARGPIYSGKVQTSDEESVVYFYRPDAFYMGGTYPYVYVDEIKKFALKNNGYNYVKLSPGKHTFNIGKGKSWSFKDAPGSIDIEPNKSYYIRVLPKMSSFLPVITSGVSVIMVNGACTVQPVSENEAIVEIKQTKLSK